MQDEKHEVYNTRQKAKGQSSSWFFFLGLATYSGREFSGTGTEHGILKCGFDTSDWLVTFKVLLRLLLHSNSHTSGSSAPTQKQLAIAIPGGETTFLLHYSSSIAAFLWHLKMHKTSITQFIKTFEFWNIANKFWRFINLFSTRLYRAISQKCFGNTFYAFALCRSWSTGSHDPLTSNEDPALWLDEGGNGIFLTNN